MSRVRKAEDEVLLDLREIDSALRDSQAWEGRLQVPALKRAQRQLAPELTYHEAGRLLNRLADKDIVFPEGDEPQVPSIRVVKVIDILLETELRVCYRLDPGNKLVLRELRENGLQFREKPRAPLVLPEQRDHAVVSSLFEHLLNAI